MKSNVIWKIKMSGMATILILILFSDFVEAQAGKVHRSTRRRTAIVVSHATHEKDQQQYEQQQQQQTQQQQETTEEQTQPPPPPPPPPAPESQLPVGTVVSELPGGCVSTPVDNVQYYQCGPNYYKVAYQGSNLVYVTTDPPK
ncbi:MAG: hypothetical protein KAS98_16515 [Deltaproteobacteria bacterium]|nr:hypothetical protein [Deltaproteobacteria bacterium]